VLRARKSGDGSPKPVVALILSFILLNSTSFAAQIQQGTIVGRVIGPDGAAVDFGPARTFQIGLQARLGKKP
jgi:hypothetical protein